MFSLFKAWIRGVMEPCASLVPESDGYELWISGMPLGRRYLDATNRFLTAWFGDAWPGDISFSRHPLQAVNASAMVDEPLTEALRAGDGRLFLSLLAGGFTSVRACLEVANDSPQLFLHITHELESPAFRIHLPSTSLPNEGERELILSILQQSAIRFEVTKGDA